MIQKISFLFLVMLGFQNMFSQEIYFQTGLNSTSYAYENSFGESNENLEKGTGAFYEIGYQYAFPNNKVNHAIGLSLNAYNAIGGNAVNTYQWNTQYIGINNQFSYLFIPMYNLEVYSVLGLNTSTILSGSQKINGVTHDLKSNTEFSGIIFTPSIGLQLKTVITGGGTFLSLGYNFTKSLHLFSSSEEKLSFNTHQLSFGVHMYVH